MNRRAVISLIGGATAWPLAARAQQSQRMRRIGVLVSAVEGDPRGLEYVTAFAQGLAELGWAVGRNVRIEYRWGAGDLDRFRRYAAELVALSPDVGFERVDRGRVSAGKPHRADCVRDDDRSCRRWLGREPVATWYQRHRICRIRIQHERQMAGTAKRDRARRKASGGHSRSFGARRLRRPGGDPNRGAFVGC